MRLQVGRLVLAAATLALPTQAAIVYSISAPTSVSLGDSNDVLDFYVTNTGSSAVSIAAFALQIATTDTDISFTGADTNSPSYIFAGNSLDDDYSLGLAIPYGTSNPQILGASDDTTDASNISLAPGTSLSLGEAFFDVASNAAPGPFTVSFSCLVYYTGPNPVSQPLADCNNLAYADPSSSYGASGLDVDAYTNADIAIVPNAPTVPEPASALLALAGVLAFGAKKLAHKGQTRP